MSLETKFYDDSIWLAARGTSGRVTKSHEREEEEASLNLPLVWKDAAVFSLLRTICSKSQLERKIAKEVDLFSCFRFRATLPLSVVAHSLFPLFQFSLRTFSSLR